MSTTSGLLGAHGEQLPVASSTTKEITPARAGTMGAALGLGVGLLFGELIVPGVIIAVVAGMGIASMRSRTEKAKA